MSEFSKGFGRGLGFGTANQVMNIAGGLVSAYQTNKMKHIQENTANGYMRKSTKLSTWFYVLAVFTIPYCFIWIPIYGIIRFFKTKTKISYIDTSTVEIPDRRYRTGYRTEYVSQVKSIKDNATPEEIQIYKKQGKWILIPYIVIMMLTLIISLFV